MEAGPHMEKQSTDNLPEKKSDLPKSQSDVEKGPDEFAEANSNSKPQSQMFQYIALLLTFLTAITYYFGSFIIKAICPFGAYHQICFQSQLKRP